MIGVPRCAPFHVAEVFPAMIPGGHHNAYARRRSVLKRPASNTAYADGLFLTQPRPSVPIPDLSPNRHPRPNGEVSKIFTALS